MCVHFVPFVVIYDFSENTPKGFGLFFFAAVVGKWGRLKSAKLGITTYLLKILLQEGKWAKLKRLSRIITTFTVIFSWFLFGGGSAQMN